MRNRLDRFCYKYERYGIRNLTLIIVAVNVVMYIANYISNNALVAALYFNPVPVLAGEWWRLFSFLLVPDMGDIFWFLIAMLFIFSIGRQVEYAVGKMKFTLYYLSGLLFSVLFAAIITLGVYLWPTSGLFSISISSLGAYTITAYPIKITLLLAYAALYPDSMMRIYFIIPVKAKWLAIVSAVLLVLPYLRGPYSFANLYPLAALGNYFLFFAPNFASAFIKRTKNRNRSIKFEKAVKDKRKERGYTHKCAVCGITDTDAPGAEFRYCSLCSGYQCYCSKHIFEHEHTKG